MLWDRGAKHLFSSKIDWTTDNITIILSGNFVANSNAMVYLVCQFSLCWTYQVLRIMPTYSLLPKLNLAFIAYFVYKQAWLQVYIIIFKLYRISPATGYFIYLVSPWSDIELQKFYPMLFKEVNFNCSDRNDLRCSSFEHPRSDTCDYTRRHGELYL